MDLNQSIKIIPDTLLPQHLDQNTFAILKQFRVVQIKMYESENMSKINIDIKLKRIFSYHFTNTYMPTTTLLIIAEITLHFDESKTEMAIGLSLTIMLVMYTMYQSISESLIKTAYLKMIDYWLLFCLLMPFVIFMIEIYWLLKKTQKLDATAKRWLSDNKEKTDHRKIIQYAVHGTTILFIIIYILIAVVMYFELS
jgi:hypothetical protein